MKAYSVRCEILASYLFFKEEGIHDIQNLLEEEDPRAEVCKFSSNKFIESFHIICCPSSKSILKIYSFAKIM